MGKETHHRCPFCRAAVTLDHETHRLKHTAPVCEKYRKWIDDSKKEPEREPKYK
jgi:hypothetical protein